MPARILSTSMGCGIIWAWYLWCKQLSFMSSEIKLTMRLWRNVATMELCLILLSDVISAKIVWIDSGSSLNWTTCSVFHIQILNSYIHRTTIIEDYECSHVVDDLVWDLIPWSYRTSWVKFKPNITSQSDANWIFNKVGIIITKKMILLTRIEDTWNQTWNQWFMHSQNFEKTNLGRARAA